MVEAAVPELNVTKCMRNQCRGSSLKIHCHPRQPQHINEDILNKKLSSEQLHTYLAEESVEQKYPSKMSRKLLAELLQTVL